MTRPPAHSELLPENERVINVETELGFGQAYARPVGVEQNIVNPGSSEFAFIEIELK